MGVSLHDTGTGLMIMGLVAEPKTPDPQRTIPDRVAPWLCDGAGPVWPALKECPPRREPLARRKASAGSPHEPAMAESFVLLAPSPRADEHLDG
jgi:hypothetical protein